MLNFVFKGAQNGNNHIAFNIPHLIALNNDVYIYVADPENKRVHLFNGTEKFIKETSYLNFRQNHYLVAPDNPTSTLS